MLWQIVKKQGLILMRNRQHLLLLIGLPIILISILSIALGGFMSGNAVNIDIKVAVIEHGDEKVQADRFISEIEQSDLPNEAIQAIIGGSKQLTPIQTLKNDVFGEVAEFIHLEFKSPQDKEKILADDSYAALIDVPENFTYDVYRHVFQKKDTHPALQLYVNNDKQLGSQIVGEIIEQFEEQLSLITYTGINGMELESIMINPESIKSSFKAIDFDSKPISSKGYYTIAMAVMNVLFIASTIGSYAYREKQSSVFNRVIVSDVSHWIYFLGIFISTAIFAFIQLLIIFGASWIIFNVQWENLIGLIVISIGLACAVGGVAVLLTAISYRFNSETLINYFQSIIVSVFAFLGGSFFPIGDFSKLIRFIGDLTPNGASMSAYMMILRGIPITSPAVIEHLIYLGFLSVILIIIAVISFPKRGQIQ